MLDDRNKTEITKEVTRATAAWMGEHGFKPIETEVPVGRGWVADLAAVIVPTETELIQLKLVPRRPPYRDHQTDPSDYSSWQQSPVHIEWGTRVAALKRRLTCVVEVKTARGDFLGDRKWDATPPTDLAYLASQAGLIDPSEWPKGWGILELRNTGIKMLRTPEIHECSSECHAETILAIAVRRDHATGYARERELQKKQRLEQAEKQMIQRFDQVARATFHILYGQHESVVQALSSQGIKHDKLSAATMNKLHALWNVRGEMVADEKAVFETWWKVAGTLATHEESLPANQYRISGEYFRRREVARVAFIAAFRHCRSNESGIPNRIPLPIPNGDIEVIHG